MQLVEQHIIDKSHKYFEECDKLCFLSKNLYNIALYTIKKHYDLYLDKGYSEKEAMKIVAKERKISKSEVYKSVKLFSKK